MSAPNAGLSVILVGILAAALLLTGFASRYDFNVVLTGDATYLLLLRTDGLTGTACIYAAEDYTLSIDTPMADKITASKRFAIQECPE